jgi:hypothetical protein
MEDTSHLRGQLVVCLYDEDGNLKQHEVTHNLVTQVGDQLYGERAVGITTLAVPTGMQLGTGATAAAKTGAGAAIVTYITSSALAFDSAPASSLNGASRRITYITTWAAGVATNAAITEAVIINQSVATNSGAAAAATISRAIISTVNKAAGDSLVITWTHDLLGA